MFCFKDAGMHASVAFIRNLFCMQFILTENPAQMKSVYPIRNSRIIALSLMFTLLCSPMLRGQEMDHVYLKSGSVIRGKIQEIEPMKHVKIQDLCGNIWFYTMTDVEKITSEIIESGPQLENGRTGFEAGFVNMTSIGFLVGSSYNSQVAPFSLQMVNGYRTPMGLFLGFGTGVEFFSSTYMPLFLDMRYDIMGRDVVPYVLARGGYGIPLSADRSQYDYSYEYYGGPLFGAGVGLKIRTRKHFAWDVELLYRYQETSYSETYDWNNQTYDYTDIFNRIEIRLGFYID